MRPLRAGVTEPSRVMLPSYAAFFMVLGLAYLLAPRRLLLETPGLDYADQLLTVRAWGALFLAAAAVMAAALTYGRRDRSRVAFRAALAFCGLCMAVFALVLLAASLEGVTHPAAWAWPAIVVAACRASYLSLTLED